MCQPTNEFAMPQRADLGHEHDRGPLVLGGDSVCAGGSGPEPTGQSVPVAGVGVIMQPAMMRPPLSLASGAWPVQLVEELWEPSANF